MQKISQELPILPVLSFYTQKKQFSRYFICKLLSIPRNLDDFAVVTFRGHVLLHFFNKKMFDQYFSSECLVKNTRENVTKITKIVEKTFF